MLKSGTVLKMAEKAEAVSGAGMQSGQVIGAASAETPESAAERARSASLVARVTEPLGYSSFDDMFSAVRSGGKSAAQRKLYTSKAAMPSKSYDAGFVVRQGIAGAKKALETGGDFSAAEIGVVKKYGLGAVLPDSATADYDIISKNNPLNKARLERARAILEKQKRGAVLTQAEENTLTTVRLINEYNKINAAVGSTMTANVLENAYKLQTVKSAGLYDEAAYGGDKIKIGKKSFAVGGDDVAVYNKLQRAADRGNLYINAGLEQYAQGINTLSDILGGVSAQDIADKPAGAYSTANAMLKAYYNERGENLNSIIQDTVTNIANNAPGMLVGLASGVPLLGQATFGISVFGNSYSEAARLGVYDEAKLLSYAFASTASEVALGSLLGGLPGIGGLLSGETVEGLSEGFKSVIGKAVIKAAGNATGEFIEEGTQSLLSPILQKYILGADVATVADDPRGALSAAAYEGFIGALTSVLTGSVGTYADAAAEANLQACGEYYKSAFAKSGADVKSVAKFFEESLEEDDAAKSAAARVAGGDTSELAVGAMMSAVARKTRESNEALFKRIGESVRNSEGGVAAMLSAYERLTEKDGYVFPDRVEKLYYKVKKNADASDEDIGRLALAMDTYAPRAVVMGELVAGAVKDGMKNTGLRSAADGDIMTSGDDTNVFDQRGNRGGDQGRNDPDGAGAPSDSRGGEALLRDDEGRTGGIDETSERGRVVNYKNSSIRYKEAIPDNGDGYQAYIAFINAGINAVFCDGFVERKVNDEIILSAEAFTAPDSTVYISNKATLSAKEIYDHERVHIEQRKNSKAYLDYEEKLCSNLLISSIDFENICEKINRNYYGSQYDVSDLDNANRFIPEITAYINQYVLDDSEYARELFGGMFIDWDRVVTIVEKFNEDIGISFDEAITVTENEKVTDAGGDKSETTEEYENVDTNTELLDGGEVSAVDGNGNGVREQGENSELYDEYMAKIPSGIHYEYVPMLSHVGKPNDGENQTESGGGSVQGGRAENLRGSVEGLHGMLSASDNNTELLEGKEVSAADKSENGLREQGENSEENVGDLARLSTAGGKSNSGNKAESGGRSVQGGRAENLRGSVEGLHGALSASDNTNTELLDGGEVSAVDGNGNGVREQGENSELYDGYVAKLSAAGRKSDSESQTVVGGGSIQGGRAEKARGSVEGLHGALSASDDRNAELLEGSGVSAVDGGENGVREQGDDTVGRKHDIHLEVLGTSEGEGISVYGEGESGRLVRQESDQAEIVGSEEGVLRDVSGIGAVSEAPGVFTEYSAEKPEYDAVADGLNYGTERVRLSEDQLKIKSIGRNLGHDVVFENTKRVRGFKSDGYIEADGTIHIDYAATAPVEFILKHELTHFAEGTDEYADFARAIKDSAVYEKWIGGKVPGEKGTGTAAKSAAYREQITEHYAANGVELTPAGAEAELIANFTGEVLFRADGSGLEAIIADAQGGLKDRVINFLKKFTAYLKARLTRNRGLTAEILRLESLFNAAVAAQKNTAVAGGVKYLIAPNATAEIKKALKDINYRNDIMLTESSPSIIANQNGVRNLPMMMRASHIRENILTEDEAREMGLKIDEHTHYHGLGIDLFIKIIVGLDDINLAYRGTKNAGNPARRENYFLLISKLRDAEKNIVNIPVYIDEMGQYNRVYIDTNKIATVFGRENLLEYIQREMRKGNLVRIKNRSTQASERTALIAAGYSKNTSANRGSTDSERASSSRDADYTRRTSAQRSPDGDLVSASDTNHVNDASFGNSITQNETVVNSNISENGGKYSGSGEKGIKYSIGYTTDNRPVAVIEEDILAGVPKGKRIKAVKEIIFKRFSGGIPIGGRLIKVNAVTRREYTKSKYSQYLRDFKDTIYADKFRAAGSLDEILLASTNYINEGLKHKRKDNFKEFARGDVLIRVGGNDYTAKVIVGFTTGNSMVLYDVVSFKPTSFRLKGEGVGKNKGKTPTTAAMQNANMQNAGSDIIVVSSDDSIAQNDTAVNNNISGKGGKYSGSGENNGIKEKNRSTQAGELASPINDSYGKNTSANRGSTDSERTSSTRDADYTGRTSAQRSPDGDLVSASDTNHVNDASFGNSITQNGTAVNDNISGNDGKYSISGEKSELRGRNASGGAVARFARTVTEGGELTDELLEEMETRISAGDFDYTPVSDAQALAAAREAIESGKAQALWKKAVRASEALNKKAMAAGEELLRRAIAEKDTRKVLELTAELSEVLVRSGQTVQAASIFKRLSGAGRLMAVQKMVDVLNADRLKKYGNVKEIRLDERTAYQLANSTAGEDVTGIYEDALRDIAAQTEASFTDKWNAWRYMAMLVNPTTHVRNILGNAIFVPMVRMKDFTAAALERVFTEKGQRTKALRTEKRYRDFAEKDAARREVRRALESGGHYSEDAGIEEYRKIFKTRALEFIRRGNGKLLEAEDAVFKSVHYKRALAGFLQARGADLDRISESLLWEGRAYAMKEALRATFNDANAVAQALNAAAKKSRAADVAINGILPFKRTPINIVRRGIEYSPVGLLTAVTKGTAELSGGKITAAEYIDGLGAGISGTAVFAIGMLLASMGLVTGGMGDDAEDDFRRLNGEQEYALQVGGKSYTIDWAAPACIPFFIGVELTEALRRENEGFSAADISEVMWSSFEPILELSMLSGVQNMIESVKYSDGGKNLVKLAGNIGKSYLLQGLPATCGKLARVADGVRRTNYVDKNSVLQATVQEAINDVKAKTPVLAATRPEYIDAWGRTEESGSIAKRIFENYFSPGYSSEYGYDEVARELMRLACAEEVKAAGINVFPRYARRSFTADGETKYLTADEYTRYAKAKGRYSYGYVDEFLRSKEYAGLSDTERAYVIEKLYEYAGAKAKAEVSDYEPEETTGFKNAVKWENGGGSVVIYYVGRALSR